MVQMVTGTNRQYCNKKHVKIPSTLFDLSEQNYNLTSSVNVSVKLHSQVHIKFLTCSDFTCPDLTCPDLTLPDFTLPDLTLPDLTLPYLTLPELTCPNLTCPYLILTSFINRPRLTMLVKNVSVKEAIKSSIFGVQKAAAPKIGVAQRLLTVL